jgi:hypothetical protein
VSDRITFTRDSADRIAAAVRRVEIGDRTQSGPTWDLPPTPASKRVFRICTFTGSWPINASKTVTFRGSTATVSAINLFAAVGNTASSVPKDCAIAKDGTQWYLIAAVCETAT